MRQFPVHACSDVTGYGLLGHAYEMASGSGVTIGLDSSTLPLLPRAPELAENGCVTGGCRRNREYLADKVRVDRSVSEGLVEVAFDPQTSGGLLIAVPKRHASDLVKALRANGAKAAAIVGYARAPGKHAVQLV